MPITMADVAKHAGVSKSTVSRALSGDPRVREDTRRRIVSLSRSLGYRPNPIASGLATRKTHRLGLVIPAPPRSFSNPFYLEFIGGVGDYTLDKGFTFFFARTEDIFHKSGPEPAIAAQADGFILTEPQVHDTRIPLLNRWDKPFVFLGNVSAPLQSHFPDPMWVDGDNAHGAETVVKHLVDLGHERIGCIAGSPEFVASHNRLEGFERALCQKGLNRDERALAYGDFTEEGGRRAAKDLLRRYPEMTALFASNDLMAIGAIHAFHEAGIRVPQDISVAGFDGIHLGRFMSPQLTTAEQPIYDLGRRAGELLIRQIRGENATPRHVTLPCHLRVGASSAPLER